MKGGSVLDGAPICLADLFVFREVVDEAGVNHAIGGGGSTPQASQILKITPMDLGTCGGKRLGKPYLSERVRASPA